MHMHACVCIPSHARGVPVGNMPTPSPARMANPTPRPHSSPCSVRYTVPRHASMIVHASGPKDAVTSDAPKKTVVLKVEGMVCDACSSRTENTLVQRSDVETASVNLEAGLAEVVVDSSTSEAELVEAVESLGFAVSVA
ncbi:PCC1 [Auxenochlorella protothecoides x Auxenochlorella symbiontica]|uniref:HMA domain-containing protein n=1 Tax=Auxenochlorella protothecoides TaxID=3075 RepID=A0A1D2A912_AUXPR